jgi:hypothetical protein
LPGAKTTTPARDRLPWPFAHIVNSRGKLTVFVAVHGPVWSSPAVEAFGRLRRNGFRFVGFTSYTDFPRRYLQIPGPEWLQACEAWCHCFREPEAFLPHNRPRALISYSDFVDLRPQYPIRLPKQFDVAYVCPSGDWKAQTKNWPLAKRCLIAMLDRDPGLRIALVGRSEFRPFAAHAHHVTAFPELDHSALLEVLSQSRCGLFTSIMDASPRLIPESLCLNVPVAVNSAILGGWKYVNRHTGRFFGDEASAYNAVTECIRACPKPCAWYTANYGPRVSGRRLASFLREIAPFFTDSCVGPDPWRQDQIT